jgi:membrane protein implicated in regulation of membrane protease activity
LNAFFVVAFLAVAVLVVALVLDDVADRLADALGGPDWLSLPVLAALVAGFGFAAGLVDETTGSFPLAVAGGLAGGVVAAWGAFRLVQAAIHMPTDPPVRHADLRGRTGRVVTPITPARGGEVLVELAGVRHKLRASSDVAVALGTEVVVVEVMSPTSVVVTPFELPDPTTKD